ncbi:hypothetical protein FQN53_004188 [Emmonsiellopsis sp. PD_33]|nr:hypothetical protein FQN53_004188 [Emmonsiellopsis sp. PD_33]
MTRPYLERNSRADGNVYVWGSGNLEAAQYPGLLNGLPAADKRPIVACLDQQVQIKRAQDDSAMKHSGDGAVEAGEGQRAGEDVDAG